MDNQNCSPNLSVLPLALNMKKYIVLLLLLVMPLQSFAIVFTNDFNTEPSVNEFTLDLEDTSPQTGVQKLTKAETDNLISLLRRILVELIARLAQSNPQTRLVNSEAGPAPLVSGANTPTATPSVGVTNPSTTSGNLRATRKDGEHFNIMWIEPVALWPGVGIVTERPTTAVLREYVTNFHELGVDTMITAYSEFIGCTFYKSSLDLQFYRYFKDKNSIWQNSLVNPKDSHCPLLSDGDFYSELFKIANELDMKIIVGLSRGGDWTLMEDIEANLKGMAQDLNLDVNARLSQSVIVSNAIASELYQLYGHNESFAGWYLPHEVTCIDVGANYYDPVGKHLRTLDRNAEIVISPPATAEVCYGGTLEERLRTMPVDTLMIQDAVGPAYDSSNTVYRFTDAYRKNRIAEVGKSYPALKKRIESAGKKFVINVEGWEMDGRCGGKTNEYGCPYPGEFDNRVVSQLETHWKTTHNLMINPSFQLFDFGANDGLTRAKSQNETRARAFAQEYTDYLDNR